MKTALDVPSRAMALLHLDKHHLLDLSIGRMNAGKSVSRHIRAERTFSDDSLRRLRTGRACLVSARALRLAKEL